MADSWLELRQFCSVLSWFLAFPSPVITTMIKLIPHIWLGLPMEPFLNHLLIGWLSRSSFRWNLFCRIYRIRPL
jgi:hypothetical protein